MMAVPALALIGVPFTSGALAKSGIKAVAAGLPEPWLEVLGWALPGAAVGTSLLMLRLLDTLPQPHAGRCSPALWLPAAALTAAGLAVVVVAGTVEVVPSPSSAGLAVAPLLAALVLRALWRGLRRLGVATLPVPAGDLVVVLEGASAALRSAARWPGAASVGAAPGGGEPAQSSSLSRVETMLASPGVGAALALALLAALGAALAMSAG